MSSLSRAAANLPIKAKILAGFGVVLAILMVSAVTAYTSFTKVERAFTALAHRALVSELTEDVSAAFTRLRLPVQQYALTGDAAAAAAADAAAKTAREAVAKAAAAISDPERAQRMREIGHKQDALLSDFGKIRQMRAELDHLQRETMDVVGPRLAEDMEALVDATAQAGLSEAAGTAGHAAVSAMQLRLVANKMLQRHDNDFVKTAEAQFDKLDQALARLQPVSAADTFQASLAHARQQAQVYAQAFHRAAALTAQLDHLMNESMRQDADTIMAEAQAVVESADADKQAVLAEAEATMARSEWLLIVLSVGAVVVGMVVAWIIGGVIGRPVVAMTAAMRKLAEGLMETEIPARDQKDEIGTMAQSVQVFKESMIEAERLRTRQQAEQEHQLARARTIDSCVASFESVVEGVTQGVASAATELESTARAMSATAEETTHQATAVSAASAQTTQNVQTVAAAAEELSSSIHEISQQIAQSSRLIADAVQQARDSDTQVRSLAGAAQKIGDVVGIITHIAGQTNLLALNATIEAARAGDAGKGFAVVASEVKALAGQTARATDEISQQIKEIQEATQASVQSIQGITGTIGQVSETAAAIAAAVDEQSAATQEIARSVQQAAQGTQEVAANIGGVSEAASQTGAAASQMLSATAELSQNGEALTAHVTEFLRAMRAA
ncbi:methyl-accepting chemotaxis protein [Rhodopila sp.]|uniref:methyl-accepting chemotaxis protein n=1 Tax=Rhodopila sp. TaxID=2480087 RepID=UPI002C8ACFCE|nr:HAMP domain-containing methyl-accepting chemotaxis protein [Rhodopila sp.]HVZ07192.1 HAMP domain-containing methyl-accepting chemotaxis protein [Rhodopila sp.]